MIDTEFLVVSLMQGFEWFDESLQRSLKAAGLPQLSHTESMIMIHVQMDIVRPADIARSLRLSRQAVHMTIGSLVERGIFELLPDPEDRRIKIAALTAQGRSMRKDANRIMRKVTEILAERIGEQQIAALRLALGQRWGEPVTLEQDAG